MCDFLDKDGIPVRPFDKIEFWSSAYKDWIPAEVIVVESVFKRDWDWDNSTNTSIPRPIFELTITVQPDHSAHGKKYSHSQKLRKSENIRKT